MIENKEINQPLRTPCKGHFRFQFIFQGLTLTLPKSPKCQRAFGVDKRGKMKIDD